MRLPNVIWLSSLGLLLTAQACVRIAPTVTAPTILRSDDDGATWQGQDFVDTVVQKKRERTVTIARASATALTFSRANPELGALATAATGLYLTRNRGEQWVASGHRGPVVAVALDPVTDLVLILTDGRTVRRSTDGGRTWLEVFTLTKPDERLVNVAIDTLNPQRLLAAANLGLLYESTDAGVSWRIRSRLDDRLTGFAVDPADSHVLFAVGSRVALWRSTDDGATWTPLQASFDAFPQQRTNLRLWFAGPAVPTVYATGDYGLLASADLGSTWTSIRTLLPPPTTLTTIAVDPANVERIAFTVGSKLHRTDDGGATWTVTILPTNRPLNFLVRDPLTAGVLYVGASTPPKR